MIHCNLTTLSVPYSIVCAMPLNTHRYVRTHVHTTHEHKPKAVMLLYISTHVVLQVALSEHDHEESRKVTRILKRLREKDSSCYQLCHFVRQGEQPRESSLLLTRLIEDKTAGTSSYLDWILQLYRQSQTS